MTFSINSICHFFGEQPFRTRDESRNVWLLAIPAFASRGSPPDTTPSRPRRCTSGQLASALVIRGMAKLRLASEVKHPDSRQMARRRVVAE